MSKGDRERGNLIYIQDPKYSFTFTLLGPVIEEQFFNQTKLFHAVS